MYKRRKFVTAGLFASFLCLLVLSPFAGLAQSEAGMCPALVEQALSELGQNCDLLDRNSACYGYNRVDATFQQSQTEDFFSKPADRSQLSYLQTIATAPLDVNQEFWGIAVLNVQANVPNTLPGQAVTFVLLGDVEVENAVAAEDAVQPTDPITITTAVGANIRSAPTPNANVIGSVPAGTELPADALSSDNRWLRVLFQSSAGWMSREVIQPNANVGALPILSQESRSPMQSFFFTTGVGDPACNAAPPSLLVVQGPANVRVDITANGADITIGSTIALMILPGNQLQLVVISGEARLGNLTVPAGFKITAPLSEDGKTVTGFWENLTPLTQEDLDLLAPLENLPANILHYPIVLPTLQDIQALLNALLSSNTITGGGNNTQGTTSGSVDCTSFRPTSPLGGLPYGAATFYWDPAPGATRYRVNIFNGDGALVGSFETDAANTSLIGDMSGLGGGFTFSWQVLALVDGQVACSSSPVTMFREAPPAPVEAPPAPQTTPEPTIPL